MLGFLALIALVATSNAAFPFSLRQSIDSGGAGVFEECAVVAPDAADDFKCHNCVDEACPDYCCLHEFQDSLGASALLCEIDGCCVRVVADKLGHQMFVKEVLTATGRRDDGSIFCGEIEGSSQCPSCAYAFLDGRTLKCPNGFLVPARSEPNIGGIFCSAVPGSKPGGIAEDTKNNGVAPGDTRNGEEENYTAEREPSEKPPRKKEDLAQETPLEGSATGKQEPEDASHKGTIQDLPVDEVNEETEEEEKKEMRNNVGDSPTEGTNSAKRSTNKGLVAGATLSAIVVATGLCLCSMLCIRKRQRQRLASLPFAPPKTAESSKPSVVHAKAIALTSNPTQLSQEGEEAGNDSTKSQPASDESWPASPPRVATKRRRQLLSPLAPLQRPMPTTPPESEAGESTSAPDAEQMERAIGGTPYEGRSDSETEIKDMYRNFGRGAFHSADRGDSVRQNPLRAPLSSLIPPIIPSADQDKKECHESTSR